MYFLFRIECGNVSQAMYVNEARGENNFKVIFDPQKPGFEYFRLEYKVFMESLTLQYAKPFCYILNEYTSADIQELKQNKDCAYIAKPINFLNAQLNTDIRTLPTQTNQYPIPFYSGTNLHRILDHEMASRTAPSLNNSQILSNLDKFVYAYQVACAFQYLHNKQHYLPYFSSRDVFVHCNNSKNSNDIITNAVLVNITPPNPQSQSSVHDDSYYYINYKGRNVQGHFSAAKLDHPNQSEEDKKQIDVFAYGIFLLELFTEESPLRNILMAVADVNPSDESTIPNSRPELNNRTESNIDLECIMSNCFLDPEKNDIITPNSKKNINWFRPFIMSPYSPWYKKYDEFCQSNFPSFFNKLWSYPEKQNVTFDYIISELMNSMSALGIKQKEFESRIDMMPQQIISDCDAIKSALIRFPHLGFKDIIHELIKKIYAPPRDLSDLVTYIFDGTNPFIREKERDNEQVNLLGFLYHLVFDSNRCDATEMLSLFRSKYEKDVHFFSYMIRILEIVLTDPNLFPVNETHDLVVKIWKNIFITQKLNKKIDVEPIRADIENLVKIINESSYQSKQNLDLIFLEKVKPEAKLVIEDSTKKSLANIRNSQTTRNERAQDKKLDVTGFTESGVNQLMMRALHSYNKALNMSISMSVNNNTGKTMESCHIDNMEFLKDSLKKIGWQGVAKTPNLISFSANQATYSVPNEVDKKVPKVF